jgi:uncharacterized membrane protein
MKLGICVLYVIVGFFSPARVLAQEENTELIRGTVESVEILGTGEESQDAQRLDVVLKNSEDVVEIINNPDETGRPIQYKTGDKIIVGKVSGDSSETTHSYYIADFYRTPSLAVLGLIFVVLTILVAGKRGVTTILSTAFSVGIIYAVALPRIIQGHSPVATIILISLLIIPVSFYMAHGFNRKTHVAILSTTVTLVLAATLSWIFVSAAKLTGFSTDEALFLQIRESEINMRGILLAGLLIGFLGVLDDVTIAQSGLITQLKKANPNLGSLELYKRGMAVGKDHVTSMVNTLVLVYTGASLPMVLLFFSTGTNLGQAINAEILAEEIVRTLLGSIALIAAIPLSTLLAALTAETESRKTG